MSSALSATGTTWPIPAPGDISSRAAAAFEQMFPPTATDPGIDARSANTVATTLTRIFELCMLDLYYYQGDIAVELMPDTAVNNLPRFATIYNVPRDQPEAATGNIIVTAGGPMTIPSGVTFSVQGSTTVYTSTESVTATAAGAVSLPVVASPAGTAGDLPANTSVTITSPVEGLTSQNGAVDANGIENGADLESITSWRARILAEIRNEPSGGNYGDYVKWATAALPDVALAACPAAACGGGVVSVVVAMAGLVPPNATQLAEIQAYVNEERPVTAVPTVYACTLNPVAVTLHLNPDTPTIRAAAQAALALSFAQDAAIGATTYVSRLNAAVSSSDGEYSHEMTVPAADVAAPTLFALNTLGTVTFV